MDEARGPSVPIRLMDSSASWQIGNVLLGTPPPENATGGRIAFKTGTSYGYRDAWSVGFDGPAYDRRLGWPTGWCSGARPRRPQGGGADPVRCIRTHRQAAVGAPAGAKGHAHCDNVKVAATVAAVSGGCAGGRGK